MVAARLGIKLAGAGLALIGVIVWAAAAVISSPLHPEFGFFWVIFGGLIAMGGIALMLAANYLTGNLRGRPIPFRSADW